MWWRSILLFLCCIYFMPVPLLAGSNFTVGFKDNIAWFIKPDGSPFISMGVNAISDSAWRAPNNSFYNPIPNQYGGDFASWSTNVLNRLIIWKFNTLGSWCDSRLYGKKIPFCLMLNVAPGEGSTRLDSVFSTQFEENVKSRALVTQQNANDPLLIGYFLDNELPWWGEYGWKQGGQRSLLEKYSAYPLEDPNKQAFIVFMKERYTGDISKFNSIWNTHLKDFESIGSSTPLMPRSRKQTADSLAFTGKVADRFFEVCTKAIRGFDPDHLILGVRFAGENPWQVVEACGKWCDVVSVNHYSKSGDIDTRLLDNYHAITKKPILITEYSFRSMENQSGDPNTKGADVTVQTQQDRAEHLKRYVTQALNLPYLVGLHWFSWADESPKGRFDGEDSNYGLVDIHDKEYVLITRAHTWLNSNAVSLHSRASSPMPSAFLADKEPQLRERKDGKPPVNTRTFFNPSEGAVVNLWGDTASGGKSETLFSKETLTISYSTGTGWGCGASFPSNIKPFTQTSVVDVSGYKVLEFTAKAPQGLVFSIFLGESGNAEPSSSFFNGIDGADGESWELPSLTGTGKWKKYRIDLSELQKRTVWGNQKGNDILDLQALSNLDLYFPGKSGDGKIEIKNMTFQ